MARWVWWVVVAALVLAASPAEAHKLKVFATTIGRRINGTAYFVGGGPAKGAAVRVETRDGQTLATLQADDEGKFTFAAEARIDHVLVVDSGDGHSARFTVAALDLPESLPAAVGALTPTSSGGAEPLAASAAPLPTPAALPQAASVSPEALQTMIAEVVAQQVRPLREQLNNYEDQVRLRDIVGGLGYILGIAGLAVWLRAGGKRGTAR